MKNIYLTCGIPGSGKTTYIQQNFNLESPSVMRISADSIRHMLHADENIQGIGKKVFGIVYSMFEYALTNSEINDIIIDNTNVDYKTRKKFYDIISRLGMECNITLLMFTNFDIAYQRNKNRERVVPDHVLDRMKDKFELYNEEENSIVCSYVKIIK